MSKRYFIKLRPLNSFYFGSIKEFGDRKNPNEYFLKSERYPQQTAVLGMLRKKILEDNELLVPHEKRDKVHRSKEIEYIGEIKKDLSKSVLGKILELSSIQIYVDDVMCCYSYYDKKDEIKFSSEEFYTNKGVKKLYEYDAKNFGHNIVNIGKNKKVELEESIEVGINSFSKKNSTGDDKTFFKKSRYKFKTKNCYFGFYIELEEDVKLKNGIVQLGDRHSIFTFEVEEAKENIDTKEVFEYNNAILFISDCFLEREDLDKILKKSKGLLIQNNKFKFLVRDEKNRKMENDVQNLISRGSIILLDDEREILNILGSEKYNLYKKVGFNNFINGGTN